MIKFRSCIIIVKATLAATVIFWFGGVYHDQLCLALDNGQKQVFWRNAWYSSTGLFRDPGTSVL